MQTCKHLYTYINMTYISLLNEVQIEAKLHTFLGHYITSQMYKNYSISIFIQIDISFHFSLILQITKYLSNMYKQLLNFLFSGLCKLRKWLPNKYLFVKQEKKQRKISGGFFFSLKEFVVLIHSMKKTSDINTYANELILVLFLLNIMLFPRLSPQSPRNACYS